MSILHRVARIVSRLVVDPRLPIACALAGASACATSDAAPVPPAITVAAHDSTWHAWQASRTKFLVNAGSPLTYTALRWLHPGANTIGADSSNAIVLVGRGVPARLGVLVRDGNTVRFEPAPNVNATVDSVPATVATLRTDGDSGRSSRVQVGSAGLRIIRRLDSLGVRAWDSERAELKAFPGLTHFPRDTAWRLGARFVPYETPKKITVMTEAGVREAQDVVGVVHAKVGDSTYTLTAFRGESSHDLFFVFTDATSGDDTYGFRFLHAARDTVTNVVTLDFNFAYNPDCAFTAYATCPLPPVENHIHTPIRAGERAVAHEGT